MATVHLVLQGKGGVGKTMLATVLAQYLRERGQSLLCVDTDPINATFFGFGALEVQRLEIMEGDEINSRNFDAWVDLVATTESEHVITDNGASSFVPLAYYLVSNEIPGLLASMGHTVTVHTVITAGQALLDTLTGFDALARQLPTECRFVVWLNPFWGEVTLDGKTFEEMAVYKAHKKRVSAIVRIPRLKEELHGHDFGKLLESRLTFAEALAAPEIGIMVRQRLQQIRRGIFDRLDEAAILDLEAAA
jgi:hypothetical protein